MIRHGADMFVEPRFDMIGKQRGEYKQSPHSVDDAGDAGQQFDRDAERTAQKAWREFGQENGDTKTDRNRDQQRDSRGDQRADYRYQRAKLIVDRVPVGTGQKPEAKSVDGRQAAHHQ